MTTKKVRVHEIAKQTSLSNKEVIAAISKHLGIEVKSHASTVSQEEADKLFGILDGKATAAEKKAEAPKKPEVKAEVEPKAEPKPKVEEAKPTPPPARPAAPAEKPKAEERPERRPERPPERPREGGRPQFVPRGEQRPAGKPGRIDPRFRPDPKLRKPHHGQRPMPQAGQRPAPQGGQRPMPQGGQRPMPQAGQRPAHPGAQKPAPQKPGQRPPLHRPTHKPAQAEMPPIEHARPSHKTEAPKKESFKAKEEREKERLEELKLKAQLQGKKAKTKEEEEKPQVKEIAINAPLTVGELAEKMDISVAAIIKQLMMAGVLATVNQTIEVDTAKKAAEALEYKIIEEEVKEEVKEEPKKAVIEEAEGAKLVERAPVVTIMGHVDHGKTTLLDAIRKTKHKIVSTEAGGITQSIGAYTAKIDDKKIVFIDTPGHSAFTEMRARGAQATDIVILVVAADDGIMPQTIEAINHAKAAGVPIIIAVNKIDKENADPDRVLQQLTEHELVPEKWGGSTITVELSALQCINLEELLEYIILVSEIEELKADPDRPATGVIIESKLDKGKGAVATFLVQSGTLKVGDYITTGTVGGKIRALIDDSGERIHKAGPSTPVEVLGLPEIPEAGDRFDVVGSDKEMKDIITKRKTEARASRLEAMAPAHAKRETMINKVKGEVKELNIILKASTHGSAEAVSQALQQLETKQIFVKLLHVAVGDISEADVMLASASEAIIIGFDVKEDPNAQKVAAEEDIIIRKYDIIYKMLEDIEQTMLGLLEPEYKEVEIGTAEVRQIFTVGKNIKIAGCYVLEGKVIRNKDARVLRDNKEIYKGALSQLKRFKDDVKEVASGYECGISFDKFNDLEEGDIIKVLTKEEIKRHTLV